ncbi:MAG: hypothetical protein J6K72_09680 [Clostridia bacterium]|nr:hypothetical protein [Clostridia bacterium]
MNKKIIKDIRLYKSELQNESGNDTIIPFADKKLNAITQRIVMKLRENNFSLGEFDHLYINFTTCDMSEKMSLSEKVDRYHPWYRYCDVHVEKHRYDELGSVESYGEIIHSISAVLIAYFATEDFDKSKILSCIHQAVEEGENMLMKFKEKVSTKRKAVIFLRYLDTCRFYPLLRVYDTEENLLFEKDLPETLVLDYIGEIQISTKKITIKPRKNAFTTGQKALVFEY